MIRRAVWLAVFAVPVAFAEDGATWCRDTMNTATAAAAVRMQGVPMPEALDVVQASPAAVYIMRRAYEEVPALDYTQPPASLVRPRLAQEFAERIYADCLTAARDE